MTWTYNLNALSTSRMTEVRMMVQDIDTTDQLVQDEEINLLLSYFPPTTGKPAWAAAAAVCDTIVFRFAQDVQNSVGPIAESSQQRYEHYLALAQNLRVLSVTNGKGIIPGSLAGTPLGSPQLGGGGSTYLGTSLYMNPEGI